MAAITPPGLGYLSAILAEACFLPSPLPVVHYNGTVHAQGSRREAAGWERESERAEQQQNGQRSLMECCKILFQERATQSAKCPKFPGNEENLCRAKVEVGVKLQTSDFVFLTGKKTGQIYVQYK